MSVPDGVKSRPAGWEALFASYRIGVFRGQKVVQGELQPGLSRGHPDVARFLRDWEGQAFFHEGGADEGGELVLVESVGPPEPARLGLHLFLFLLTVFTTHMAGALLRGIDPLHARAVEVGPIWLPMPTTVDWSALAAGAPFALCFLAILLAHEMGHWSAARFHGIRVTLPFFIPFPAYYSVVGTLGAFIRIRGPTVRRSILFDIGAAGPVASFVLSIPVLLVGLSLSEAVAVASDPTTPFAVRFAGQTLWIGTSPLVELLTVLFGPPGDTVLLNPLAFAGWLGLFVTMLNLLPFGQLDGGHILYTLSPGGQRWASRGFLLALIPLGLVWWGWWFWVVAAFVLSRGRLAHPPVLQEAVEPTPGRRRLAWLMIAMFFLTFTPVPLEL